MSIAKTIVGYLNKGIQTNVFKGVDSIKLYGITQHMPNDEGVLIPNEIKDGEGESVMFDDNYAIVIYHRLDSVAYSLIPSSGFGDSQNDQRSVRNMSMYLAYNTERVKVDNEAMIERINTAMAIVLSSSQNAQLKTKSVMVEAVGAVMQSKENDILKSEFNINGNELFPKLTMARIRYNITSISRLICVNPCNTEETCLN
jgi:hypothetical protein